MWSVRTQELQISISNKEQFSNTLPHMITYYNQKKGVMPLTSKAQENEERTYYVATVTFLFPSLFTGPPSVPLNILDKTSACLVFPS